MGSESESESIFSGLGSSKFIDSAALAVYAVPVRDRVLSTNLVMCDFMKKNSEDK